MRKLSEHFRSEGALSEQNSQINFEEFLSSLSTQLEIITKIKQNLQFQHSIKIKNNCKLVVIFRSEPEHSKYGNGNGHVTSSNGEHVKNGIDNYYFSSSPLPHVKRNNILMVNKLSSLISSPLISTLIRIRC